MANTNSTVPAKPTNETNPVEITGKIGSNLKGISKKIRLDPGAKDHEVNLVCRVSLGAIGNCQRSCHLINLNDFRQSYFLTFLFIRI